MGLIDSVRDYFAMRKFMKSPLALALREHTQEYFYRGIILSDMSEENKQKQVNGLMSQLGAALASENPAMAVREGLVGYTIQYAKLQVLCLTSEEKAEAFYYQNPYISGELHNYIDQLADQVEEVKRFKWENNASKEDLVDFCNGQCALYLYYLNAFNLVRMEIGDKTDPDWFRPLVEAQLVYEENSFRNEEGLPLTVNDMIEALTYSAMFSKAADGAVNPFFEWCTTWPDMYLAGRGPLPPVEPTC